MKILAIERELPGAPEEQFKLYSKAEAARVWELYQAGVFRELYFRQDWPGAVLMLECADTDEANKDGDGVLDLFHDQQVRQSQDSKRRALGGVRQRA
jgi:hypothetical protein